MSADHKCEIELLTGRMIRLDGLEQFWTYGVPVLLEPLETPVEKTSSDPSWSVLPDDADSIASTLCVIWFQDEFAFPIDPHIKVELAALDWESRAAGWLP